MSYPASDSENLLKLPGGELWGAWNLLYHKMDYYRVGEALLQRPQLCIHISSHVTISSIYFLLKY